MKQKIKVLRFVLCSPFNPCSPFIKGTYTSNYKAVKSSEHNKMEDRSCESTRIGQSKPSNNSQSEPLDFDPSVTSSLI